MVITGIVRTKYDGAFLDPDVEIRPGPNKEPGVFVAGFFIAYLGNKEHIFWALNPGLRERVLQQVRAETLVSGNL
jgi:hypothetical protein